MPTTTADDYIQIQQVRHRYGRALDERDWGTFESLFTNDVDVDFTALGAKAGRGREVIVALMKHAFRRDDMKSHQLYANFEIAEDESGVSSVSSLVGRHYIPGSAGGETFTLHARYHDRLMQTPAMARSRRPSRLRAEASPPRAQPAPGSDRRIRDLSSATLAGGDGTPASCSERRVESGILRSYASKARLDRCDFDPRCGRGDRRVLLVVFG